MEAIRLPKFVRNIEKTNVRLRECAYHFDSDFFAGRNKIVYFQHKSDKRVVHENFDCGVDMTSRRNDLLHRKRRIGSVKVINDALAKARHGRPERTETRYQDIRDETVRIGTLAKTRRPSNIIVRVIPCHEASGKAGGGREK